MDVARTSTSLLASPTLIEGVGNEALIGFFLLFFFIIISFFFFKNSSLLDRVDAPPPAFPPPGDGELTPEQLREQFLAERRSTMSHHYQDRQCPICLGETRFGVETNCGHLFCGPCVTTYWTTQHPTRLQPMPCPCCRQSVSVLFQNFSASENAAGDDLSNGGDDAAATRADVVRATNDYNRRFSGLPRPWLDYLYDLPVILRHLWTELFTIGGLATVFRLRVFFLLILMVVYVISPLDIIPEAVLGVIGFVDDIFILVIFALYISIQYRRVLAGRGERDD